MLAPMLRPGDGVTSLLMGQSPIWSLSGWVSIGSPCDFRDGSLLKDLPARNLKYYPLSLYLAIKKGKLQFLTGKFEIENCQGETKIFDEMTAWEPLNLRPDTVLSIPQHLYDHHNISNDFLDKVMVDYNIQNISKSQLEEDFLETDVTNDVKFPFRYMVGKTRHYSWPKGAGKWAPIIDRARAHCEWNSNRWSRLRLHVWNQS